MQKEINAQKQRINTLLQLLNTQPDDAFLNYALGLEWVSTQEFKQAEELFAKLIQNHPDYIATYYQLAKVYEHNNEKEKAIATYQQGISTAIRIKDTHTLAELRSALNELEFE